MELKYGSTTFVLDLPPERLAGVVAPTPIIIDESPSDIIEAVLEGCHNVISSFKPGETVVIVTSDIIRYAGSELYLPSLIESLNRPEGGACCL